MKLSEFLENLKDNLEIESKEKLSLNDDLIQLDEWDSLTLLILINYVKLNFNIEISSNDIGESFLIKNLIELIENNSNKKIFYTT